jgi:hypothetical protein
MPMTREEFGPVTGLFQHAVAAAAKIAARNYAKDLAKKEAAKTVTKKVATKSVAKTAPKTSSAGKLDKKLNQLDRRSKAVAPKKKYSDMTPAEKRKAV